MKKHSLFLLFLLFFFSCGNKKELSAADSSYDKGEYLYYQGKYNDSFTHFYQAYEAYIAANDDANAANSLIFLAIIQTEKGDFLGSNENLRKAAKLAARDQSMLTSIYNQFAINHNALKNNKEALYCYNKALQFNHDDYSDLTIQNNMGISYLKIGKYSDAKRLFEGVATDPLIRDSIEFRNRVSDNLAYAKFLEDPQYKADVPMHTILKSRTKRGDLYGMTASFSHLADFYRKKDPQQALRFASAMYENAKKTGSADDQLDALRKMINTDDGQNVQTLFVEYQTLSDSVQQVKNNSRNQFASVIYETEKNKADILVSRNQILKQRVSIFSLIASLFFGLFWYLKRRKQDAYEKELEVKNTQLKYSKKVHDVIANGLYHTMVEIQNTPELNKENILNSIEKMYEESRDIARDDLVEFENQDFPLRLQQMLSSYSSNTQKVLIVGNNTATWQYIPSAVQTEIYYVMRELMVNMKKHSKGKFASVVIQRTAKNLQVKYTDNGLGIPDLHQKKRSGIHNMENRIKTIGGTIHFEPNPKGGLIVHFSIPIF
ncbi:MAG: hypothetical protein K0M56_10825 [Kaistella sp.]|nr:hypothetical protein [Kaistella sp.]